MIGKKILEKIDYIFTLSLVQQKETLKLKKNTKILDIAMFTA